MPRKYIPARIYSLQGEFICDADVLLGEDNFHRFLIVGRTIDDESGIFELAVDAQQVVIEAEGTRRRARLSSVEPFGHSIGFRFDD